MADDVVGLLALATLAVLALALALERFIAGDVTGCILGGAFYTLAKCRCFFGDRVLAILHVDLS